MNKAYKKLAALLAGVLCLTGIGGTLAVYTNIISVKNPFSTSRSSAVLVENFNPNSTFLPGETVEKQPYFKNTGDMDLVLRVEVTEGWNDEAGNPPTGEDAPSIDAVTKNWTPSWLNADWVRVDSAAAGKTYYYYRHILYRAGDPDGRDKTPVILDGVKLSPTVSNDSHATDYSSLTYFLDFEAEAVPNDKLSVESWKADIGTGGGSLDWNNLLQ